MFSFHRPKVYRSTTGCCICKAKSSSSRFTDSKKYEEDFLECFQLEARRQGEICNACVLLVKRWKKLPMGSGRNWRHVVDARAGPGIKSMSKFKSKQKRQFLEPAMPVLNSGAGAAAAVLVESNSTAVKVMLDSGRPFSPTGMSDGEDYDMMDTQDADNMAQAEHDGDGAHSGNSSRTSSPTLSDCEDGHVTRANISDRIIDLQRAIRLSGVVMASSATSTRTSRSRRKKQMAPKRRLLLKPSLVSCGGSCRFPTRSGRAGVAGDGPCGEGDPLAFIDLEYWERETTCCGTVFRGRKSELLIERSYLKPCGARLAGSICKQLEIAATGKYLNNSDNSSDSGYDDSSNMSPLCVKGGGVSHCGDASPSSKLSSALP